MIERKTVEAVSSRMGEWERRRMGLTMYEAALEDVLARGAYVTRSIAALSAGFRLALSESPG